VTPESLTLPYGRAIERVAREIVRREADSLPDLTRCTVVLPSLRAAPALQRELARTAGMPALLLPRVQTLRDLAPSRPHARRAVPTSARELQVYAALRKLKRFDEAALWPLAREVVALADECTRHAVALPREPAALAAALHAAYRARRNRALQFEAELVHELWHALTADAGRYPDAEALHLVQLGEAARAASGPLYVVWDSAPTRAEREFLDVWAERAPVVQFLPRVPDDGATATLASALRAFAEDAAPPESIDVRARALRADHPVDPLHGRLALYPAANLEEAARVAAFAVRRSLARGATRVALVALDRSAARRTRALLERAEVLLQDEEGWKLSTTSAAAVAMRWLEALEDGFYHRTLVDLMRSPFLFADRAREFRAAASLEVESVQAAYNCVAGLEPVARKVAGAGAAAESLARLGRARDRMPAGRATAAAWIDRLQSALDEIGALAGLRADHAGVQLLDLLDGLRRDLLADVTPLDRREFTRWLDARLEQATFRDDTVESPVVLTQLRDVALRRFDTVVMIGADGNHLPAPYRAELIGPVARGELGLPTARRAVAETAERFVATVGGATEAIVVWQTERAGDPNPPSPFVAALRALHLEAWGTDLIDGALGAQAARAEAAAVDDAPLPERRGPPSVRVADRLPERFSVSAWQHFVDCPYRFFAGPVLGLALRDEVQEKADKSEYGMIVHAILDRFHRAHPECARSDAASLERDLAALTEVEFAQAIERNRAALAFKLRWLAAVRGYVRWQLERESQGWRWSAGEVSVEREFDLGAGRAVCLQGRIDRIDVSADGRVAVLDYKTQSTTDLRARARDPSESVQLACYSLLSREAVQEAAYVGVEADPTAAFPLEGDPGQVAEAEAARIAAALGAVADGAPMPANGTEAVCAWCNLSGLCRRGHWLEPGDA
jgi:ATP-dependent helicase/nuclease subunit B